MTFKRPSSPIVSSGLLALSLVLFFSRQVHAGPITGGGGSAPFVKLGVYQGVLSIIPTGGANAMEVGNLGRDIASSTTMYLRPSSLPTKICIGGSNSGTACPNGNECLGGGVCSNTAPRVYKYPTFPEAALDLDGGRLCLHGTGVDDCRNVWPISGGPGDVNWTTAVVGSMTYLKPAVGATTIDTIQAGSFSNPVPAANGYGFEVEANTNAPAVSLAGTLGTGYFDNVNFIYLGGDVNINGKVTAPLNNFFLFSTGNFGTLPYNASQFYNRSFNSKSGINADTFDGTTTMLFPTDGNLFWKTVSDNVTSVTHLCLRTSANYLCLGGSPGSLAGTPCPNAGNTGPDQTKCNNGSPTNATCTQLCGTSNAICPADPTPSMPKSGVCFNSQRCVGGSRNGLTCDRSSTGASYVCPGGSCQGTSCNNSTDCRVPPGSGFESNDICEWGLWTSASSASQTGCPNIAQRCQDICSGMYKATCDGLASGGPICSSVGTIPKYDVGVPAYVDSAWGACFPPGSYSPSWTVECDCRLSQPRPYLKANPPGNGGDLCTQTFQ